jgi:hypothetical protein
MEYVRRKALLFTATAGVVVISAAIFGAPIALATLIALMPGAEPYIYATPFIGGGDDITPYDENENPLVRVTIPSRIAVSNTEAVEVQLEENIPSVGLLQGHHSTVLNYAASLASPAFDVSPSSQLILKTSDGRVAWRWLISPKKTGTHIIRLEFSKPVITKKM